MAVAELNEASTKEEIENYVESVVNEVQEERAGEKPPEEKSDAQITSEHAKPKKETPVTENKPGDEEVETAEVEDQGEEESAGQDWLDDDLKSEIAAYGIEESEITDFANREELERALRFFDKSALDAGRKALAESEPESPVRNDKGQFAKVETKETPPADTPERVSQHEIKLDKDAYDDEIVSEFTRMRDHYDAQRDQYESRLEALESRLQVSEDRFAESDARAEEQRFDGLVDSLGHADLFGKTGHEDAKQLQRRRDLHVAVKAQQIGLSQLGRPTDLSESLVNRVARMVFVEDLSKKDIKTRTRKISKQSNGRQGGGATRPQDPREDPRDEADRLYRELEGR